MVSFPGLYCFWVYQLSGFCLAARQLFGRSGNTSDFWFCLAGRNETKIGFGCRPGGCLYHAVSASYGCGLYELAFAKPNFNGRCHHGGGHCHDQAAIA